MDKPIHFLGKDTGLTAHSRAKAAIHLWWWLARGNGPSIPSEYKPMMPKYSFHPTMGRIRKHMVDRGTHYEGGLGLPDRRQSRVG